MSDESDINPSASPEPGQQEKSAARLALVSEIARKAHAKLEMGELLNTVADAVHRNFAYYDVAIHLKDAAHDECVLVARAGKSDDPARDGYRQKLGTGIVGVVAQKGETLLVNGGEGGVADSIGTGGADAPQSQLAVPIRLNDRTVGVISVMHMKANAIAESDVLAIETLADQIAQAIANAQLFERTRLLRDLNRSVVDAMPSGLCVLNVDLEVLYANPVFLEMFCLEEADVVGENVGDVLPETFPVKLDVTSAIDDALGRHETRVFANVHAECCAKRLVLNVRVAPVEMPEGVGALLVFENVTEWRMAMDLAEERRSYLDMIVSHVPVAVISFDLEGKITYWRRGAKHLFGYPDEEMIANVHVSSLFAEPHAFPALLETCRAQGMAEVEIFARREDGDTLPVLFALGKIMDESDHHVGYTGIALDMTERREANQQLLQEKLKLENVLGVIGAGLALVDKDRRVVWANRTIEEWFGRGDVVGQFCHNIYYKREHQCENCSAVACFSSGVTVESDETLVRADGVLRQYHHAVSPVFGPSGQVEQVLYLTLDVTDQSKKVYQLSRLRQLGELMQGMLDLDRLLHFILTCVTAGQALGFNRAVLMLVDNDRNVVEGKLGVGPSSQEEASRIWDQISQEGSTLEDLLARYDEEAQSGVSAMDSVAQSIFISLDETSHIVSECVLDRRTMVVNDAASDPRVSREFRDLIGGNQFVIVPLIVRNQAIGVVMADNLYSRQPISEEHVELLSMFANQAAIAIENAENHEALHEEKQHLEQAYRDLADTQDKLLRSERLVAIGRMASHVAHEIRNPLVTIGGFADIVRNRPDASRKEIVRYADIITAEVHRLENILARVMDFSRPPAPLLRDASIHDVVRATAEQLRPRAERQNVEIKLDLAGDETRLQIDPDQMKQVLINLFQNALDIMKDAGCLSVQTSSTEATFTIKVINTGEAVRPEDMPNLFEPFFTTKPGGTGLGLAVTQKIVQEHHGEISARSTLGQRTEFIISLPLSPARG